MYVCMYINTYISVCVCFKNNDFCQGNSSNAKG